MAHAAQAAIWAALSELRYIFKHALLRDAAYDMQVRTRRAELHLIAAEALEAVYAADAAGSEAVLAAHLGEIGYHYEAAYQLGLSNVRDKARDYLLRAGDQARQRWENAAGIDYATRALALMPEEALADRFEALINRFRLQHSAAGRWMLPPATWRPPSSWPRRWMMARGPGLHSGVPGWPTTPRPTRRGWPQRNAASRWRKPRPTPTPNPGT